MTMSYATTPPARARNDVSHEEAAVPGEVRRWRALTFVLVHGAFQTGAAWESEREKLAAYAARQGVDIATYLKGLGPALTPEQAGEAIVDLASGPGRDQDAYLLTAAGLSPVQH
jgi:hypothetical protein